MKTFVTKGFGKLCFVKDSETTKVLATFSRPYEARLFQAFYEEDGDVLEAKRKVLGNLYA